MDELELVKQCIKGNSLAQKAFFDKFAPLMMTVSLRYMKSQESAEDVLQEAFVKIFKYLPKYKFEGALGGWVRKIVVNTCLDHLRKEAKLFANQPMEEVEYKVAASEGILDKIHAEELLLLIQSMPKGYRIVFNLYAIEGYSHQEIAKELNITESTSKSQYLRARAYLRERIFNR